MPLDKLRNVCSLLHHYLTRPSYGQWYKLGTYSRRHFETILSTSVASSVQALKRALACRRAAPAIQPSVGALKERELYGREFVLKYITLDENVFVSTPNRK